MAASSRRDSWRPHDLPDNAGAVPAISILATKPAKTGLHGRLLANALPVTGEDHRNSDAVAGDRNLVARSNDAALFHHQSLGALRAHNPRLALELIARACVCPDVPGEYHRLHAEILRACGRLDAALGNARLAVKRDGRSASAWGTLAAILAELRQFDESSRCFETAIDLDSDLVESRHNLAIVLQLSGRTRDAELRYGEVLERAPDHVLARINHAGLMNTLGRYDAASAALEAVFARDPGVADAHLVASSIEYNRERYQLALDRIDQAIALAPGQVRIRVRRAEILGKLGRYQAALDDCDIVLARFPEDGEALRVKSFVLRILDRPDDALVALHAAQAAGSNPDIAVDQAWLLAEMGRKNEALLILDQALSERQDLASALYCRAFLARPKPGHRDVAAMERIAADDEAPAKDRMRLSFSLGKIHLDAGDGQKAFAYLDRANAMKRRDIAYDRRSEEQWFTSMMVVFSAENMARHAGEGLRTTQPIFVFGMPRSGTTLVEQILASHRLVRGKGETAYMNALARSSIFPAGPTGLSAENLRLCANRYLELAGAGAASHLHFVDKTPSNFQYAGLISRLLPGARMIHCRRDALETCLSCYSLLFNHGNEFSYSQAELGHYYGQYRSLMAHWNAALPAGSVLDVDYEALVSDTEAEVRRLLDFCALPWDDACLRFYETKRLVTSSSLDQVRSPIYRTSLRRARSFLPWLGELERSLKVNAVEDCSNS